MKHLFLPFLFLLCMNVEAKEGLKKISAGIRFAPEYSFRFLKAQSDYQWLKDSRDDLEKPKLGFSFGPEFTIRLKKKFYGTVAICIANKGYQTKNQTLIYNTPEEGAPTSMRTKFSTWYMEVPLKLNYQLFNSCSFYITAGVMPSLAVYEKTKFIYENEDGSKDRSKEDDFLGSTNQEKLSASGYIGFGYFIKWKNWSAIKVEPFFKCEIAPHFNSHIREYFYSAGIDLGFYFRRGE